ncbi:hypothetical protein D9611_007978 [Ephemerocybe angulata]|uniref:Uncharacterized protein n=1 Tax=Ephemerocybe angulata TaxID=980116 RepID=A0A8H5FL03_9AGAR|nr:hypothetical protein D9611_007978 [Tulosesus angulatus]
MAYTSRPHQVIPPYLSSPPTSPRSTTENDLADNVTSISRQLLDSFAFSQVDNLVGDLAHMRRYLVSKLPDPLAEPPSRQSFSSPSRVNSKDPIHSTQQAKPFNADPRRIVAEYKGALYGRRCLSTQEVILEYLLGRCLQQCQVVLEELELTHSASQQVEESADYVLGLGQALGAEIDPERLEIESANLFTQVRKDLFDLSEELKELDGARETTADFRRDPSSVLRPLR